MIVEVYSWNFRWEVDIIGPPVPSVLAMLSLFFQNEYQSNYGSNIFYTISL